MIDLIKYISIILVFSLIILTMVGLVTYPSGDFMPIQVGMGL